MMSSRLKIILLLSFTLIYYQCNDGIDISKIEITFNGKKTFFKKNSEAYTGDINEYYDDGKVKMEMSVLNGFKEGLFKQFHTNGNLQTQSNFIKGEIHGKFTSYHQSGSQQIITFYNDNHRHGSYEEFHENGQLKKCGNYYMGMRIGKFYEYFISGGVAIYNY